MKDKKGWRFYLRDKGSWFADMIDCIDYIKHDREYKLYNADNDDQDNLVAILPIYNVAIICPVEKEE